MADGGGIDRLGGLHVGARRRLVARTLAVSAAQTVVVLALFTALPLQGGGNVDILGRIVLGLTLVLVLVATSVRSVLQDPYPLLRAVHATIVVVVTMLVVFASTYVVVSAADAAAFSEPLGRIGALYFSVTTATTIGYGDIAPVSDVARIVVMIHMVANVVVLGVAVRALLRAARDRSEVG